MRLFVVETLGTGGMIHYVYQLCTALAEHGADVTLVTAQDYELGDLPHNFTVEKRLRLWKPFDPAAGQRSRPVLHRIGYKIYWAIRRALRGLRFVLEWINLTIYLSKQRPDLVQFGKINFPFESLFLARLRHNGLVLTQICHEFELRERDGGLFTALANRLYVSIYDNFSAIFLHGHNNRQRFLALFQVPAERTFAIPFGNESMFRTLAAKAADKVDLRHRYGLEPDEPVVLFFGTLTPSKGLPELLEAFALVRRYSRARLVVAGFPTKHINMDHLHQMAAELGIADSVIFDTRYIPFHEIGPLMELARVVVYPYRNSTQSAALQMAYAFGRPVIATRVGGLPEVVEEGRSGFIVSPRAPEELAAALAKVVDNPQLAAEMGAYAFFLSETRHAWLPIAGQIMEVYKTLLDREEQPLPQTVLVSG